MKTTYKFILAALAATVTLASCTKDPVPGKSDSDSAVTYRTITVSFDSPTKAKLDGTKPKFQDGDTILLSNMANFDTCRVTVNNDVATIQTKLGKDKELFAVYPMKAALCTEPNMIFQAGLYIPTKQSGKFSDANICRGKGVTADKLLFTNEYPILRFYVDSTIAVSSIEIKSNSYLAGNAMSITLDAGKFGTLDKVTGERVCYVAVREDVKASDLTFVSTTETQGVVERKSPSNIELVPGFIYNAFIPYSIQVGDQKWGYCNVGGFLPEDPGEYFMWGEVQGHKADTAVAGKEFQEDFKVFNFDSRYWPSLKGGEGFAMINSPFYNGTGYSRYTGNGDILVAEDDAATVNWGSGWRMPDAAEFNTLTTVQPGKNETMLSYQNVGFPYAGYGENVGLAKGKSFYWTRTISDDEGKNALAFHLEGPQNMPMFRYNGFPIRPIYDETISGDDAVGLQISPYTDGKTL